MHCRLAIGKEENSLSSSACVCKRTSRGYFAKSFSEKVMPYEHSAHGRTARPVTLKAARAIALCYQQDNSANPFDHVCLTGLPVIPLVDRALSVSSLFCTGTPGGAFGT
jgi:hypothetical protein